MEIYKILKDSNTLSHLFDFVRVVDPIEKCIVGVIENKYSNKIISRPPCYEFLKRNKACDNCISIRAYNEDKPVSKIEFNNESIYFIIASTINIDNKKYILEALKDITEDHIVDQMNINSIKKITKEIKRLNEMVIKDELTNCYNRKYLNEVLPVNIIKNINEGKNLAVCMMDIDEFKSINDTYGHLCGDAILKEVGRILNLSVRKNIDYIIRYGGDEFIIVLNDMEYKNAINRIERIKTKLENKVFKYEDNLINLTSSFGISFLGENLKDYKSLIDYADKMLYKSKGKGKDNISFNKQYCK